MGRASLDRTPPHRHEERRSGGLLSRGSLGVCSLPKRSIVGRFLPVGSLLASSILASCGDLTSGGFGEVEVLITADSVLVASGVAANLAAEAGLQLAAGEEERIMGTLTIRLQVDIRRGPDEWIELTDGVQEVTLALGSHEAVPLVRREVRPGRYAAARTRFRLVRAEIQSGLMIGGEPFVGSVMVPLPTEGGAFVLPVELDVVEGQVRGLFLELRADRWLPRVDPLDRTVPRRDFEEELRTR